MTDTLSFDRSRKEFVSGAVLPLAMRASMALASDPENISERTKLQTSSIPSDVIAHGASSADGSGLVIVAVDIHVR